ncbi:response regulator [Neolewinella persica]|uniref:response regulator n=1 Tax=Neolewinella persica TaxID=70998 RepID=UPI00037776D4|nr:response regulator [Neolewinella persica]
MLTQLAPKILILERQLIIAADISLQFTKLGYDVIGINIRSEDALKTIQKNRPDIIVMNIVTQGKATGIKAAQNFFEAHQIPIVFLSAKTDKSIFEDLLDAQPYAFIAKPFNIINLKRGIETTLRRMTAEGLWAKDPQVASGANGLFIHKN